jgi:hypothetical protein
MLHIELTIRTRGLGDIGPVWMHGVNIYLKVNDLPLAFASNIFFFLGMFGLISKCGCRWEREGWAPPQIYSNLLLLLGVFEISGVKYVLHHISTTCLTLYG